jgi:hypothetical protein
MASDTGAQLHTRLLGRKVQLYAGKDLEMILEPVPRACLKLCQGKTGEIVQVYIAHGKPRYTLEFDGELFDLDYTLLRLEPKQSQNKMLEVITLAGAAGEEDDLECPYCHTTGLDNFFYVEDVSSMRDLISLKEDTLMIRSRYDVADEGSHNERLGCRHCDKDCAFPSDVACDFE